MYFDFEQFCKRLHGLTRKQIQAEIDSKGAELDRMEKSARGKRKKRRGAAEPPPPDYRSAIAAIGRLAQYVLHGGVAPGMSEYEIRLAKEVLKNMREEPKKKSS